MLSKLQIDYCNKIYGLTFLSQAQSNLGNNSKLYLFENVENKKYLLKLYKNDPLNSSQDRFKRESYFYQKFSDVEGIEIPRIKYVDSKLEGTFTEFVEKGNNSAFQENIWIEKLMQFIDNLNSSTLIKKEYPIMASEYSKNEIQLFERNLSRLIKWKNNTTNKIYGNILTALFEKLIKYREYIDLTDNNGGVSNSELIISPGDLGPHNFIPTNNSDGKFIDFEYAGLDNPLRVVLDFLHNPSNASFSKFRSKIFDWIQNYSDKRIDERLRGFEIQIQIRWYLIKLKHSCSKEPRFSSEYSAKIIDEFSKLLSLN